MFSSGGVLEIDNNSLRTSRGLWGTGHDRLWQNRPSCGHGLSLPMCQYVYVFLS